MRSPRAAVAIALGFATLWLVLQRFAASPDRALQSAFAPSRSDPWISRDDCLRLLREKRSLTRSGSGLRVVSWNLRWFPDGAPTAGGRFATDVGWLSCALRWLDADAVALQEVKDPRALGALGAWKRAIDSCPDDGRGHLAILWDEARVDLVATGELPDVNPLRGCTGRLRPGLWARVRSRAGGTDLTVVDVHLDSGRESRDRRHRRDAALALAAGVREIAAGTEDPDVVVLGDFNAMGADSPPTSAAEELAALDLDMEPAAARLEGPACSEYHRKGPSLLDLAFASGSVRGATLRVEGFCRSLGCTPYRAEPAAYRSISDHCPLVLDLGPDERD